MIQIFYKEYDGESMYDFYRDVSEATVAEYNPLINDIPVDEDGFQKGKFIVTIRWENE